MARSRTVGTVATRRRPAKRQGILSSLHFSFSRRQGAILLLVFATLDLISLVIGDGGLAGNWNSTLRSAFGWGAILTPLLTGVFGLALLWPTIKPGYQFRRREAIGWLMLFGSFITLFQFAATSLQLSENPQAGGGFVGKLVVQFMTSAMGPGGAIGTSILAVLLGSMLAGGFGPREVWAGTLLTVMVLLWLARRSVHLLTLSFCFVRGAWTDFLARRASDPEPHFRINRPDREEGLPESTVAPPRVKAARVNRANPPKTDKSLTDDAQSMTMPLPLASTDGAARQWVLPPLSLLDASTEGEPSESDIRQKVQIIEETLRDFGIGARVVEVNPGPVVTQFGLDPGFRERRGRGGVVVRRDKVKVSEITGLRDDLALALAARTVRIEAPVPGRAVIGLEIPNSTASVVGMRQVVESAAFQRVRTKSKLAVALGQDVSGGAVAGDLAKMPHLLIAGATGSGKSVCMNSIVTAFLLHTTPDELRMVMIDPKRVELTTFRDVPHLLRSVVVDADQAVTVLKWVMREMETRLKRFEAQGVRNIDGYNRAMGGAPGRPAMPHMAVLIDELADLMMTAPDEVERSICRLAQLARATGIHLVIATQRPSVDVVTGLIKANLPTRISFAVASQVDSRTILDAAGAEQLLGSGDMLYMPADAAKPRRLQGVFVSDDEVKRVVEFWKRQGPPSYVQELEEAQNWSSEREEQSDPLYDRAVEVARQHTRISASLLQRRLGVGYNRAARLVDLLEERGVVGSAEGGKPREVLPLPTDEGAEPVVQ